MDEAQRAELERAVAADPTNAAAWLRLGILQARRGASLEAVECYERVLRLDPGHAEAWMRVGTSTFRAGLIREAEAPLRRALELDPGLWPAAVALATVLERDRRLSEAEAVLSPLLQGAPPAKVAMTWAGLQLKRKTPERALDAVEVALKMTPPSTDRALLLHAHADLLDALGRWEAAFGAYAEANRAWGYSWDPQAHRARVDALIRAFSAEAVSRAARATVDTSRPVLLVGLPRTGSTLLEQMLAQHSQVGAAGELDTLRRLGIEISKALGAPGQWFQQPLQVPAPLLDQGAGLYLQVLARQGGPGRLLVDKMPDNVLQLGLAALMLPGARVLHLRRDPVDSGWSCFRQPFGPGLAWSCSLEHIAAYQRELTRIMAHWRQVLDLPILELDYEALVAEPEATLGQVLDFLGLDLEEACLRPHQSERLVATASHASVQEPVSERAVGRAEPYRPWLGALARIGEE